MKAVDQAVSTGPGRHAVAGLLAMLGLCAAELLMPPTAVPLEHIAHAFGLAVTTGATLGLGLWLALEWVARTPRVGPAILPTMCCAGGYALVDALDAVSRLDGRYRGFAIAVLAAGALGTVALSALCVVLQTRPAGQPGLLRGAAPRTRNIVALLLVVVALALLIADRRLYVGLYPVAHVAMRLVCAILATLAVGLTSIAIKIPWRAALAVGAATLGALASLGPDDDASLTTFDRNSFSGALLQTARRTLDWDGDGFAAALGGGDCNDLNPRIYPAAREVPLNGVDDNCYQGDARARRPHQMEVPPARGLSPLNVVLITVDTLRWDRLGQNDSRYGPGGKETMPNLDRWARDAVNFQRAYAPGSWTSISLGALMHGRSPRNLRWVGYYETDRYRMMRKPIKGKLPKGEKIDKMFPLSWDGEHPPLAHWLRQRDMKTIAVVDDGFSQMLARDVGAATGFQVFREISPGAHDAGARSDQKTTEVALANLEWAHAGRPFFLWVHYFGPHAPNHKHPGIRTDGDSKEAGYDHEVRYLDQQLGLLLDALEPHRDSTAVFVTADHGEDFFDTHRSHGMDLRESLIRVPLVARVPGWRPQRFEALVGLVDLMPTIMALTKTPAPTDLDGIDLTPYVEGRLPPAQRYLYLDNWFFDRNGKPQRDQAGAHDGQTKLLLNRLKHSFSLFGQNPMVDTPLRNTQLASGPPMRALMRYLEHSGGQLAVSD